MTKIYNYEKNYAVNFIGNAGELDWLSPNSNWSARWDNFEHANLWPV